MEDVEELFAGGRGEGGEEEGQACGQQAQGEEEPLDAGGGGFVRLGMGIGTGDRGGVSSLNCQMWHSLGFEGVALAWLVSLARWLVSSPCTTCLWRVGFGGFDLYGMVYGITGWFRTHMIAVNLECGFNVSYSNERARYEYIRRLLVQILTSPAPFGELIDDDQTDGSHRGCLS